MTKTLTLSHLARASCTLQIAAQDSGASHLLLQQLEGEMSKRVTEARASGATDHEVEASMVTGAREAYALQRRAA